MIFAAGLGTRLRPLTNDRPKALVELNGKPLLEHVIGKMKAAGITRIVVNVHHYAAQIEEFLKVNGNFGIDIIVSDERECLLDTGGGLLKAKDMFIPEEPVLIHNVDIFSDLDLCGLVKSHRMSGHYVTLVTRPSAGERVLKFNEEGILKGWENEQTGEQKIVDRDFYTAKDYSFCGIHVVSPAFLGNFIHAGVFSIIDEYLAQAREQRLCMYAYTGRFIDLGTPEAIREAELW